MISEAASPALRTASAPAQQDLREHADEISLSDIVRFFWSFRTLVGTGILFAIASGVFVALGLQFYYPSRSTTELSFRFNFEGAPEGRYPSGEPFSPEAVIAPHILNTVHASREINRWVSFEAFVSSIQLTQSSEELARLSSEYRQRLADPKLSAIDRAALEEEFKAARATLNVTPYTLSFVHNRRVGQLPPAASEDALRAILRVWSEQADLEHGALRYRLPMFSQKLIELTATESDDVGRAHALRTALIELSENMEKLQKIPGATTLRLESGLSLPELSLRLQQLRDARLEPLLTALHTPPADGQSVAGSRFLESKLNQLNSQKEEVLQRQKAIEYSLNALAAESPSKSSGAQDRSSNGPTVYAPAPVSDALVERILTLSARTSVVREKLISNLTDEGMKAAAIGKEISYYEGLRKLNAAPASATARGSNDSHEGLTQISRDAEGIVTQMLAIYSRICTQNLNAASHLYAVQTASAQQETSTVSSRTMMLAGMGTAFGILAMLFGVILVRHILRNNPESRGQAIQGT